MIYLQLYWPTSSTYMVWPNRSTNRTRENNLTELSQFTNPHVIYVWRYLFSITLLNLTHLHDLQISLQIDASIFLRSHRAIGTLPMQRSSMWFLINHGGIGLVRSAIKQCIHMETNINALSLHVLEQQEDLGAILLSQRSIFPHTNYCFSIA
jgi:hypothetical protein